MAVRAIAFDFDGVILESVDLKTRAFRSLFTEYPQSLDDIIRLHLENGGLSRYAKFEMIYRDCLNQPLSELEKERLGRRYSTLVANELERCPFVPGAQEFLQWQSVGLLRFVVSGTPEDELRQVVKQRALDHYFAGIFGSPSRKESILQRILVAYGLRPSEVVFVGDSMTDCTASGSVGVPFVGRVPAHSANCFPDSVRWIISDLNELGSLWPAIQAELS